MSPGPMRFNSSLAIDDGVIQIAFVVILGFLGCTGR